MNLHESSSHDFFLPTFFHLLPCHKMHYRQGQKGGEGCREGGREAVNRQSEWHAWTAPLSLKDTAAAVCMR